MTKNNLIFRQGDVLIMQVKSLPTGLRPAPLDKDGAIVLAFGEQTGHRHAIYDHIMQPEVTPGAADEIAEAAIARAQSKARLWAAPDGARYLEVSEAVTLKHEEHDPHVIPPGCYKLPLQMEYRPRELVRVSD